MSAALLSARHSGSRSGAAPLRSPMTGTASWLGKYETDSPVRRVRDLPLRPALHGSAIEPSDSHQHVNGSDMVLSDKRSLRGLDHAIGEFGAILGGQGTRMLRSKVGNWWCQTSIRTARRRRRNSRVCCESASG